MPKTIYWAGCSICQYMKKNPQFRYDVMVSTYFNKDGKESLLQVNRRYGGPFKQSALYMHMQRHQAADIMDAQKKAAEEGEILPHRAANAEAFIDVIREPSTVQKHEQGLDDFISAGREKLKRKEMSINAATFLTAIKIKSDIEKSTKDRKLDAIKSFFGGGNPTPPRHQESG